MHTRDMVNQTSDPAPSTHLASGMACLAGLLLFLPLAWPLASGRAFLRDDLGGFHFPLRHFYAHCLATGDDFRWHPGLYCGFYIHGEGQAGMAHPLHLLLYRTLPLATAFQVEILIGYPMMFLGMGLWLRWVGLRDDAAWYGAIVFSFSEFMLLRYIHMNAIQVIAHWPWLLLGIEVLARPRSEREATFAGAGIAALTASQGLLGYPQYIGFSLILEGGYALLRFGPSRQRWTRLILAKTLGLVAAGAQIVPLAEALRGSYRASPTPGFLGQNSLHPLNLAQLVVPMAFRHGYYSAENEPAWPIHESVAYLGAVVPASIAWLWLRRAGLGRWRPIALGAAGLGLMAVVLSLGRYLPYPLFSIYARFPMARLFRAPSRYLVIAQMASAVLAAIAFADLASLVARGEKLAWRSLRPLVLPIAAGAATVLGFSIAATSWPSRLRVEQFGTARDMIASAIFISSPCVLMVLGARGWRFAPIALIGLAAADAAAFGVGPILAHERPIDTETPGILGPAPPAGTTGRVLSIRNESVTEGARLVGGYVALAPKRVLDFSRASALRVAGAEWERDETTGDEWEPLPLDPLPRARLVGRAIESQDPAEDLERIDPMTSALIATPIPLEDGPPGSANLVTDRPGLIHIRTMASSRRLLVVSEAHHAGWKVSVDGLPANVVPVYGDFLGCVVDSGPHDVLFQFDPESDLQGRWLSLIGFVGIAIDLGWRLRRSDGDRIPGTGEDPDSGTRMAP